MAKAKRCYRNQSWDDWFLCAKAYYKEHGDLLIPANYVTADGYRLGRWIERQRAMYNHVIASSLDMDQQNALEQIGMVWKLENRLDWEKWISMAQEYHETYGHLQIPSAYITKDGYRLGFWLREQRKRQKAGLLSQKQVADLDRFDMIWMWYERNNWDYWYNLAEAYYKENGHLLVPFAYQTADGHKLGLWISIQRERYQNKSNRPPLLPAQIEALDHIAMVWSLSDMRSDKWEVMYEWVSAYLKSNKKLPLQPGIKAPDGRSMGNWISVQRTALSKGKLPQEKEERLAALGIFPFGYRPT